jgi:hypothetical protein
MFASSPEPRRGDTWLTPYELFSACFSLSVPSVSSVVNRLCLCICRVLC